MYQEGVEGTPGFQDCDGEVELGGLDGRNLQPRECLKRLIVRPGVMVLRDVVESLFEDLELVEFRVEGFVGEVGFGGDDQTAKELVEVFGLKEEVEDLFWGVVHQGVVHKHDGCGGEVRGSFWIPN